MVIRPDRRPQPGATRSIFSGRRLRVSAPSPGNWRICGVPLLSRSPCTMLALPTKPEIKRVRGCS
ncbi:hypothetical protein APX70_200441 [Pseudomonas syringae pv. maculicola]|uniref:Uncharacterized protein n=1 Tax=Pseudomonas syringae pv. maculicola TaxID=59511 RepID=A0A3M2X2Y3_PSEYM|nr:hypothetical protein APX70_200441 [Pseudomonas syringae pv. maculicola]